MASALQVCLAIYLLLLLVALRSLLTGTAWQQSHKQHLFLSSCVILMGLWSMRAGLVDLLEIHMLGLTVATLTLGAAGAMTAGSLALVALAFMGDVPWYAFGGIGLFQVALPIGWTVLVQHLIWRWLPHHLFVYIFVGGFACAALSQVLVLLAWGGLLAWLDPLTGLAVRQQYWPLIPLLLFPEGLLNGMPVTLMAIYRPHWLALYDDQEYVLRQ